MLMKQSYQKNVSFFTIDFLKILVLNMGLNFAMAVII